MGGRPRVSARSDQSVALAALVAAACVFGVTTPIVKLVSAPAPLVSMLRNWMALPLSWGVALAGGRRVRRTVLRRAAPAGVLRSVAGVLGIVAVQQGAIAVLAVVTALIPAVVLVAAGRWLGERATRWHMAWTAVAVAGVVTAVVARGATAGGDLWGAVAAVGALVTYAGYLVASRHARSQGGIDAREWMAGVDLSAALCSLPIVLATVPRDALGEMAGDDWGFMVLVVAMGVAAHLTLNWAHGYVPAARSSLVLLLDGTVAIVGAWLIHDEALTVGQMVGCAVVLGAVAAVTSRPASVTVAPVRRTTAPAAS